MAFLEEFEILLLNAGIPAEDHDEVVGSLNAFMTSMILLMKANVELAPNFLTFRMADLLGVEYELTIRKSEGKTPAEIIGELRQEIAELGEAR